MRGKSSRLVNFAMSGLLIFGVVSCNGEEDKPKVDNKPYYSHLYHGADPGERNHICIYDDRPDRVRLMIYRFGRYAEVEATSISPSRVFFQPKPNWLVIDGIAEFKIIDDKDDFNIDFKLRVRGRMLEKYE